jgi:hypothetical protein
VRNITIAVGASILCAIAAISAEAKTDRSTCEQRCQEYYCSGAASLMLCHHECHKKCSRTGPEQITRHEK